MLLLFACNSGNEHTNTTGNAGSNSTSPHSDGETIAFKIADNYFIRNNIKEPIPSKITNQAEFDKYFGQASTMRPGGMPTPIDFTKEYVIVADHKNTRYKTDINPVSLFRKGYDIVLNYSITQGENTGFDMHPFLMLIIENSNQGEIV